MNGSIILPQMDYAAFNAATLGSQLTMALGVARTARSVEVWRAVPIAEQFAHSNNFDLSFPKGVKESDTMERFQSITVPEFRRGMRPIFDRRLGAVARAASPYEEFGRQGLHKVLLPDVASAGLVTFDAADGLLRAVEGDLGGMIDALPEREPSANLYFSKASIAGRAAVEGTILAGGLIFVEQLWAVLGISAVAIGAIELIAFLRGRGAMYRRMVENRDLAVRESDLRYALERARTARERLAELHDDIPVELGE